VPKFGLPFWTPHVVIWIPQGWTSTLKLFCEFIESRHDPVNWGYVP